MIERFNGRIAEILKTTTFASAQPLQTTLEKYLHLSNQYIPQKHLGHVTPMTKLEEYYTIKPELFQKKPTNHPGPDSFQGYLFGWPGLVEDLRGATKNTWAEIQAPSGSA